MASDFHFKFSALTGDTNGDRVVNDTDLLLVWSESLKPAAFQNLADDLNGDGQVNSTDVAIVRSHYLAALPAAAIDILASAVNGGQTQRSRDFNVQLQFSDNVAATLSTAHLTLTNLGTQAVVTGIAVAFNAGSYLATVTFPGLPNQQLADGNYELLVTAAGVTDSSGDVMRTDFRLRLFALSGDVNGDRVVNDSDLYQVTQELLKPAGSRNLGYDLNGDGQVTTADLAIVKGNYLASLPPAPVSAPQITSSFDTTSSALVATATTSAGPTGSTSTSFSSQSAVPAISSTTINLTALWLADRGQDNYLFALTTLSSNGQSGWDGAEGLGERTLSLPGFMVRSPLFAHGEAHQFTLQLWLNSIRRRGHIL
jgi:hypothetical protein